MLHKRMSVYFFFFPWPCLYLNYNKLFKELNENIACYACIVLKYRWKGENVATTEVADHLLMFDCVEEANVYGVKVPGNNNIS